MAFRRCRCQSAAEGVGVIIGTAVAVVVLPEEEEEEDGAAGRRSIAAGGEEDTTNDDEAGRLLVRIVVVAVKASMGARMVLQIMLIISISINIILHLLHRTVLTIMVGCQTRLFLLLLRTSILERSLPTLSHRKHQIDLLL